MFYNSEKYYNEQKEEKLHPVNIDRYKSANA